MVCPHLTSDICRCRKPKPGMILDILEEYPTLDKKQCLFVGDSDSDIFAGKTAGIQTLRIEKGFIKYHSNHIIQFFT